MSNSVSLLPIDKSLSGFTSNDSIGFQDQSQFRPEEASILPLSPNSIVNDDVACFNDSFSLKLDSDDDLDYGQQTISDNISSSLVLVNPSTVNHNEKDPPLSTHVSEHSQTHFLNIEYVSFSDYSNATSLCQVASVLSQSLSILSDDGGNFDISNHLHNDGLSNTLAHSPLATGTSKRGRDSFEHSPGEQSELLAISGSSCSVNKRKRIDSIPESSATEFSTNDNHSLNLNSDSQDGAERPILRPSVVEESDISDVSVTETEPNEMTVYSIAKGASKYGKDLVYDNHGYCFSKKKLINKDKTQIWVCVARCNKQQPEDCPCRLYQDLETNNFEEKGCHNHRGDAGIKNRLMSRQYVKEQAGLNRDKSGNKIAEEALLQIEPGKNIPKRSNLARMANRIKQNLFPKNPVDLKFVLFPSDVPDDFLVFDVSRGDQRHILFSKRCQLGYLSKAKVWYVDATFFVVGKPFKQLFTIFVEVRKNGKKKYLPMAHCFMSARTTAD